MGIYYILLDTWEYMGIYNGFVYEIGLFLQVRSQFVPTNRNQFSEIALFLIRVRGSPERDILSLRTLGLGLARFGCSSAGAFPAHFWQIWSIWAINVFVHDWAPEKRSQRATTGKLLGITLRVCF